MTDSTLNWEAEQRLGRIEEKLGLKWPPEEETGGGDDGGDTASATSTTGRARTSRATAESGSVQ